MFPDHIIIVHHPIYERSREVVESHPFGDPVQLQNVVRVRRVDRREEGSGFSKEESQENSSCEHGNEGEELFGKSKRNYVSVHNCTHCSTGKVEKLRVLSERVHCHYFWQIHKISVQNVSEHSFIVESTVLQIFSSSNVDVESCHVVGQKYEQEEK